MLLNEKQLAFIEALVKSVSNDKPRGDFIQAYREAYKPKTKNERTIKRLAYAARANIYNRPDAQEIFKNTGLGLDRFTMELDRRLKAEKAIPIGNGEIARTEDNTTRMAATNLLADVLGLRKRDTTINYNVNQALKALIVEVRADEPAGTRDIPGYAELQADFNRLVGGAQDSPEGPPGALLPRPEPVPGDVRVDSVGQDDIGVPEGDTVQSHLPEQLRDSPEKYV
jgi:hypothetical protein